MGRFQFSIRMMLAAVAVVGIGVALWTAEPSWYVGLSQALMISGVPPCILIAAMQCNGLARSFCIGLALVMLHASFWYLDFLIRECIILTSMKPDISLGGHIFNGLESYSDEVCFKAAVCEWSLGPVVGLLCVFTHWLLIRPPEPKE